MPRLIETASKAALIPLRLRNVHGEADDASQSLREPYPLPYSPVGDSTEQRRIMPIVNTVDFSDPAALQRRDPTAEN